MSVAENTQAKAAAKVRRQESEKSDRPEKQRSGGGARALFISLTVIPSFVLFLIFVVFPIVNLFYNSFMEWNGLGGVKRFIWFENFVILFKSANFWNAFKNTVFLIAVVTAFTIFFSLLFASVLAKGKTKGKTFFRIVFYVPNILSIVVIAAIFSALLAPTGGVIGAIVRFFGGSYTGWLAENNKVMWVIAFAMVWQAIGYYMVMYIAGMDGIPDSMYEAADLEGASKSLQFFKITLPLTWEVIRVTLSFFIISTINMSYLFVDAMTQGAAGSDVLLTYMYKQAFTNNTYGYGMAVGVILFLFAYGLALIVQKLTTREVVEY